MKIKFDANQSFQLDAVQSVVDLFEGQPHATGHFELRNEDYAVRLASKPGVSNDLRIPPARIIENLRRVQERNKIAQSDSPSQALNFSVEMETGTGKTYVYLRTIHRLHECYGFSKFIIVVPSVAIREGVRGFIDLTKEHFQREFGSTPIDSWVYDSKHVPLLRQFATSNALQVLILNIDAFNKKDRAIIHRVNEGLSGIKPIEFIQQTQPIVIIDEPQNMETDTAKAAIESLRPLCTLRYSATHRNLYNQVYRLDPVQAYDMGLVKRIEVDSILEQEDFNRPYISVKSIKPSKTKVTAKVEIDIHGAKGPRRKVLSLSNSGVDLFEKSGERPVYDGYVVEEINAERGVVAFSNGFEVSVGETTGGRTDELMKVQVQETIREHLQKELNFEKLPAERRMKVLSLFFIDRVANYYPADGKLRIWFVESYEAFRQESRYASLKLPPASDVHRGYFAASKKGVRDTTEGRKTKADNEAFELIMRDKERLLSRDEPVRFIFSHSALREGWDNPNVFQICTLNETRSEMKKRQEIGRGLRLPVQANGERCFDPQLNRLTIVANESYRDFAQALQIEIEEECGVQFTTDRVKKKGDDGEVRLRKGWKTDPDFLALWEKIKHRTRYSVEFETDDLVKAAAKALSEIELCAPKIFREKARLEFGEAGIDPKVLIVGEATTAYGSVPIPDLLGYLQRETELTRSTLVRILIDSGRLGDVTINPQSFLDEAVRQVRCILDEVVIDGIKYEKIVGSEWEMRLFEDGQMKTYLSNLVPAKDSLYQMVRFDSELEKKFALALDDREDIKLFIKLPSGFKVDTPVGTYNPDWAIVQQRDDGTPKLYLVRETKGTKDEMNLRPVEWTKIRCGKAHFKALGVDFDHVTSAKEI